MFLNKKLAIMVFAIAINGCQVENSQVDSTNIVDGEVVSYYYQTYTMSSDESADSFQDYVIKNGMLASDESEKLLPRELQGLFFLDGAPFPDKALSLKHVKPMDKDANRIRWTVPYKTSFAWLNNEKGHHAFAKAQSHNLQYELEWRDCTAEVLSDMALQYQSFNVAEVPTSCKASDRKFAVINAYAWYDGERISIPESVLYFDMYLIPKGEERDYFIWHRRSKVCSNNEGSPIKNFCEVFAQAVGRDSGDGYSRYQFTQVIDPEGRRTSKYNSGLLPEVIESTGTENNIFLVCDPSEVLDESCIDGTEALPPIKDRDIDVIVDADKELTVFEKIIRTRKVAQFIVKAGLDILEILMDGKSEE
ncbi:MAG: hypothetical protein CMP10_12290 [Zetaproteobacteria bacterium]|nr:hypothetical protein [Pseudobdellovibrionaceae bacterium]|tara:strand:+ start:661 stop:1749 length:1089 start_codon:yes stop_codon:yes gene_type:complete